LGDIIDHELTIASEIADRLQISGSAISRNLTKLRDLKTIYVTSKGKIVYFNYNKGKIFLKIKN
jgi:DNA-binding transcriptional regulator LsrR (DeoR family)